MSWLALRRLRTGPTVLVREKPVPDDLLEIATLADPAARREGDDIVLAGARIAARVELTGADLAKLSITDEERLWALRVIAQGPQPVDYFDRLLAEGIAYRLEGWAMTQGVLTDPAEDDQRDTRVYLPDLPEPAEFRAVLSRLVAPVEEIGSSWPENAELEDGLVHVLVPGEGQILYGGADVVVAGAWQKEMPIIVRARVPYATEIVALTVKPLVHHEAEAPESADAAEGQDAAEGAGAVAAGETAETAVTAEVLEGTKTSEPADDQPADTAADVDTDADTAADTAVDTAPAAVGSAADAAVDDTADAPAGASEAAPEGEAPDGQAPEGEASTNADDAADDAAAHDADAAASDDVSADEVVVETRPVALALAEAFNGVATDRWGFEITA